ncbi:MAG: sulfatase-like hydrolase/transferase, partial [Planctomycetota bacterium]
TLAEFFKEQGYRTVLLHGGFFRYTNKLNFLRDRGYDALFDAKTLPGADERMISNWGCDDAVVYEHAVRWIESGDGPFLMVIMPILPHHPYKLPRAAPKPYAEQTSLDRYHNSLRYQDGLIESFAGELRRLEVFQDTVFVVVGDHGEAFGQHQGSRIHGNSVHQESVAVPLVISNPVLFPEPQVSDAPAQFCDLLPTILQLCGLSAEDYAGDGVSLFRKRGNELSFFFQDVSRLILGLADGDIKYIWHVESGRQEMYDLRADPGERHNIVHGRADRAAYYRQTLQRWKAHADARILEPKLPQGIYGTIDLAGLVPSFQAQDWGDFNYGVSVEGNPFKLGGQVYATRGIGTHANSILQYDVSQISPVRFTATVGRDSHYRKAKHAAARFQVRLDERVVYDSGPIDATDGAVSVDVRLPQGTTLSLLTLKEDDGGQGDHCDWIEPTLHYVKAPP